MNTDNTVQLNIKALSVSLYGDSKIQIPDGYKFESMLYGVNQQGGTPVAFAICIEHKEMTERLQELKEAQNDRIEKEKQRLQSEYKKRVQALSLAQLFSDVLTMFNIGDTVYYYSDSFSNSWQDKKDEDLENHILSFTLNEIILRKEQVALEAEADVSYKNTLILSSYNSNTRPFNAFKTKAEAIAGSQQYHEARLTKKREEEAARLERQKVDQQKAEAEILRKAEEIKNKGIKSEA